MNEPTHIFTAGTKADPEQINTNFREAIDNWRNFVYGETIAVNDAVYLRASDSRVLRTNASFNNERIHNFVGFAKQAGVNGDTRKVQIGGEVSGFTGLISGADYFLSETPGVITTFHTTNIRFLRKVGFGVRGDALLINTQNVFMQGASIISGTIRHNNAPMRSTNSASPVLLKESRLDRHSLTSCRITFEAQIANFTGRPGAVDVRRNGVSFATITVGLASGWHLFSTDLGFNFVPGDLIQLWGNRSSGDTSSQFVEVRNFNFLYDSFFEIASIDNTALHTRIRTWHFTTPTMTHIL